MQNYFFENIFISIQHIFYILILKSSELNLFFCVFFLLFLNQNTFSQPKAAKDLYQKGEFEFHLGSFVQANDFYDQALKIYPKYIEVFFSKGKIYFWQKKYTEANDFFQKTLNLQPKHAESLAYLGVIAYYEKNFDKAIDFLNQAIIQNSNLTIAYHYRAESYFEQGLNSLALNDYAKAIWIEPNTSELYFGKGRLLMLLEKWEEAEKNFSKAIELETRKVDYYRFRLEANFMLKNCEKMQKDFYFLEKKYPENLELHYYIIWIDCEIKAKNQQKALELLNKTLEIDNQNIDLYLKRANIYENQSAYQKAIQDFTKVLLVKENDTNLYQKVAYLYQKNNDLETALKFYQSSLLIDEKQPAIQYECGKILLHFKKKKEAKKYFINALNMDFPLENFDENAKKIIKKNIKMKLKDKK
ncbi:MAG: hypothetical protein EAZ85_07005 [Bacteroidetes bacterium]|nr:MAG: hypothetical protein EAZ85_07005 [Bacteroidota bacterium]TAG87804.1 MAG: hypothetical protein EAZ20_09865 [Bacteroidota bacterium]